jgi:hypothetical protein
MNEAQALGQSHYSFWRKTPSQVTVSGYWFDMSMSPGNPVPQYYAASPLIAQQMKQSTDGGIRHGSTRTGTSKFIKRFLMMSSVATGIPMPWVLCDYLLYYPFVDTGTNDEQLMTNSVSLPRFTDGVGVQMMAVSVAANSSLQPTFTVNYTNQDGTAGRTSAPCVLNVATANGNIITGNQAAAVSNGCFIPLQSGDYGVRSVESVTFTSGTDVGLFALVLVKPLMSGCQHMQTAPHEVIPLTHQSGFPQIYDDSFLGIICQPTGSLSGVAFHGEIEVGWN